MYNCRVDHCDAPGQSIPFHVDLVGCLIKNAQFSQSRFGGLANFNRANFHGDANFHGANFTDEAWFEDTQFTGNAWIGWAEFKGETKFIGTKFIQDVWFINAEFIRWASFKQAEFHGQAWFNGVKNSNSLYFNSTRFSDSQVHAGHEFNSTRFKTNSQDSATFSRALPNESLSRIWHRFYIKGNSKHNWSLVRGFGELTILTRASTSALVLVPVLAAVWPGVRAMAQHSAILYGHEDFLPPNMPEVWGMLFFAALFAMLGRVVYQSSCPEEVRERSRVDVINEEMDAFRANRAEEGDRRLDEAISSIEEAGTNEYLRWFRHQNLVSHRGRTVWIPSKIEDFAYDRSKVPQEWSDEYDQKCKENPNEEYEPPQLAEAVMSRTSREDITIQAGAGAWYDIISRQNRVQARIALWCYTLGVILVGVVIWEQAISILQEMGWQELTDDRALSITLWLLALITALLIFGPPIWASIKALYQKLAAKIKAKPDHPD